VAYNGNIYREKFNRQIFELWKLKMEDHLVDRDQWISIDLGMEPTRISIEDWVKLDQKEKRTF